jgi:hypothetical protein
MPATTLATIATLQVVFGGEYHQPLLIQVIVLALFQLSAQALNFFLRVKYLQIQAVHQKYVVAPLSLAFARML